MTACAMENAILSDYIQYIGPYTVVYRIRNHTHKYAYE